MAEIVAEVVAAGREKADERHILLEVSDSASGTRVLADPDALSMICSNLVENAVKYTRDGGHIAVRICQEGMYVIVAVKDDGIGMSPEDAAKAFDEFYRARNEQTASIPGTGLGLSLVKRLTELHEGTVSVSSQFGAGSEFTVRLPLIQPAG